MTQIEAAIAALRGTSLPSTVAFLDGAVLANEAQRRIAAARNGGTAVAMAALILGIAGSAIPVGPIGTPDVMPLGALSPFAPSALLAN